MNFNLVKKPKKDEDEELMDEEELDVEEESGKTISEDAKKKMFRFMGIIVGVFILLIIILYLFSLMGRNYSFEKIEEIMEKAAISYFKDYPTSLPSNDGGIVEVDTTNLVVAGKMKDLSYYTKKGVVCSGTVRVEKSGSEYLYLPYLNCGDSYITIEFYKKIIEDNPTVSSGYGLYSSRGGYVFKGENINNYVKLDKALWQIVKINSDNQVVMVTKNPVGFTKEWDNRYNEDVSYGAGHNDYSSSRIKEHLDQLYSKPNEKNKEDFLSTHDKARLASMDLCIGKRDDNSTSKDNSLECSKKIQNQKVGLLTVSDYLLASTDPNCKSILTRSCKNYNYLFSGYDWWTITANKTKSYQAYKVDSSGLVKSVNSSNYARIRPVVALLNAVKYKSGKGTEEDPYIIK